MLKSEGVESGLLGWGKRCCRDAVLTLEAGGLIVSKQVKPASSP